MGTPGPGCAASRPAGGSEDRRPWTAGGHQDRHLWGHVGLSSKWDGGAELPRGGRPGEAQDERAQRPPRTSPNIQATARLPGHLFWVPETFWSGCWPGVMVCGGRAASAGHRSVGPGWPESDGRSCSACTVRGQGRSALGSPDQQAGQSKMDMQHRAFRAPGGSCLNLQPYHPEQAGSHLISEAKQGRAWLVLGRETAWEYQVLSSFCLPSPFAHGPQVWLVPQNPPAPDFPIPCPENETTYNIPSTIISTQTPRLLSSYTYMLCEHVEKAVAPIPVLLLGKSRGWRSLLGCNPWGRSESDTNERLHFHFSLSCIGEGNGNPLQCSCLENPRDGEAWWAAVYGVAQSRTRLR